MPDFSFKMNQIRDGPNLVFMYFLTVHCFWFYLCFYGMLVALPFVQCIK